MAAVAGLKGQTETFTSLNNTLSNDDRHRQVLLHVNEFLSSDDSCYAAKTCPLTDNGSIKRTTDVIPDPGYVIKAPVIGSGVKVFVNVCQKESIEKPSLDKQIARGGRSGSSWTIPHTLTEPVSNGTQRSQTCRVFDFLVHPDACRMAETNNRFKHMLSELAVNAVAREFLLNLNVRKLQFPKMKYKTVQVGSRKNSAPMSQSSSGTKAEVSDNRNILNFYKEQNTELLVENSKSEMPDQEKLRADTDANNNKFAAPKYTEKFLDGEEMPAVNGVTYSRMLVVDIELPLVNSALAVDLDLFDSRLGLTSTGPVRYKLDIDLPCVIDENHSCAKFVKSRRVLHVRMPVLASCSTSIKSSSTSDPVSESDANHLEERQPSSSTRLLKDVKRSEVESKEQVNSMDHNNLISSMEKSTESGEDASSEILIVHNKVVPKLHGILKQRTMSESSDDGVRSCVSASERHASTTTGSEGDDQEDSPDRSSASSVRSGQRVLKKSVSFSDHIDHTVYQANQSVSSMHAALKNRRRRARKRDQKLEQREQRRRRRNSGSFSLEESGDEQSTCVQATHTHAEGSHTSKVSSSDEADHSSNTFFVDYQDEGTLGSECASGNKQVHKDDKSSESVLQGKLTPDKTKNENYNYSDTFRTKSSLLICGSDEVNGLKSTDVCDPSVQLFENPEPKPSSMISVSTSDQFQNISESATFHGPGSTAEPLKPHHRSVLARPYQSSENVTVLNTSCVFDLDVD